jgi:hypothetical protein
MQRFVNTLFIMCGVCAALSGCTDKRPREVRELQARLATLPPRCTIGNAAGASGSWIAAARADPTSTSADAPTFVFTFREPIRTPAFRVVLNARALHNIDKVESRDAQGNWSLAWAGGQADAPADAPAGCDLVKMAQPFVSGRRDVAALRVIFRAGDRLLVADSSVLKAD